jgi:hypothetical protein
MGGHYGTIHVRTDNRDEVRFAVERLSTNRNLRFLIAPPINGWVTVFPEDHGQDSALSESLAQLLPDKTLIHCLVHDDDVFAYWLFENGSVLDTYNSCPDYFDKSNPQPRGGNARALGHLLVDTNKVTDLQKLLDAEKFVFELDRLDQFAALLALPNTGHAYEYLQDSETDGVRRWKAFIHIPDLANEKAARRAAAQQERNELKRLEREGILLVNQKAEKSSNKHFFKNPGWVIDGPTSSVVIKWQDHGLYGSQTQAELWQRLTGPRWQPETWSGPTVEQLAGLDFSPAGSLLATRSHRGLQLDVWNRQDCRLITQRNFTSGVGVTAFSPDEKWLFAVIFSRGSSTELHRVGLHSGSRDAILTHELAHFRTVIPHPGGRFLVVVDNFSILIIVDVETMTIVNQVWIRESDSQLSSPLRDYVLAQAGESFLEAVKDRLSAEEVARHRKENTRHFLPKEVMGSCCFTPNGDWLCCATKQGVRVLNWNEVLRCPEMHAVPVRLAADAERVSHVLDGVIRTEHTWTYGLTFDSLRQRVLFAGLEGKISFFHLNDGRKGDLLVVPGRVPLLQLALMPDRSALVATAHRREFRSNKESPPHFQIWNYPALCQAANLQY